MTAPSGGREGNGAKPPDEPDRLESQCIGTWDTEAAVHAPDGSGVTGRVRQPIQIHPSRPPAAAPIG
ncbi:hypothetical protein ASZ90_009108 [hydrocarbon metagenome]|uniref:Uncharacterized protein n=1 Tax=hydrocarbon metagenome TaxID=938273 RepID=A0A0W8FJR8_9ZZZZ